MKPLEKWTIGITRVRVKDVNILSVTSGISLITILRVRIDIGVRTVILEQVIRRAGSQDGGAPPLEANQALVRKG